MSADLFAAFGNPSQSHGTESGSASASKSGRDDQARDPFDFSSSSQTYSGNHVDSTDLISTQYSSRQHEPQPLFHHDSVSNTEVLFDALDPSNESFGDDADEFGDFENVQSTETGESGPPWADRHPQQPSTQSLEMTAVEHHPGFQQAAHGQQSQASQQPSLDLLDLDTKPEASHDLPIAPDASTPFDDWGDFNDAVSPVSDPIPLQQTRATSQPAVTTTHQHKATAGLRLPPGIRIGHTVSNARPMSKSPERNTISKRTVAEEEEETWEDFVDGPPSAPTPKASLPASDDQVSLSTETPERPTNVPPPSILLQLFPEIISQIRATISPSLRVPGHGAQARAVTNADSAAESILNVHTTLAHVISGRQLRWKRDMILSQSTKISDITSSGSKGMKLASVDRTESIKEDREVTDSLAIWSKNAHLFNSIVTKAGGRLTPLEDNLRPRLASGVPTAKVACAVCGLKREERVQGVDSTVEDSFGEWWIDFWGHRGCWIWWERWKGLLKQR